GAPDRRHWIEALDEGTHAGDVYTRADLDLLVKNFDLAKGLIDPPIKIGHEEVQPLAEGVTRGNTGHPAVGWVKSLAVEDRPAKLGRGRAVLLAEPEDVHPAVADLVNRRSYRKASAEIYPQPPVGAPPECRGIMFRGVALMGATPP